MSHEENVNEKRPDNFIWRIQKSAMDLKFHLSYNPATGLPLVGDTIKHQGSGRRFRITEREWQSGPDKREIIAITLEEIVSKSPE